MRWKPSDGVVVDVVMAVVVAGVVVVEDGVDEEVVVDEDGAVDEEVDGDGVDAVVDDGEDNLMLGPLSHQ